MRSRRLATPRDRIGRTLHRVFGLKQLRDGQEPVIDRVLRGLSTLAVMPTGAGKSLCYQLPAMLIEGRTVVVSPLIALMKDQCDALAEHGIDAVQTHSAMTAAEARAALDKIADGSARIVLTTPERLAEADFQALLMTRPIGLLVIDEAHCISQWGHDFRPMFLELGNVRHALGDPTVLALTATATQAIVGDIVQLFDIPRSGVIGTGVYRPNLHYRAEHIARSEEKMMRLVALVKTSEGSGIVYVATVKAAQSVFEALQLAEVSVELYHGKLGAGVRRASQDAFMAGQVRVMVATNAFGLGVDKPDIRFVLHYQIPPSLDAYYQESGRAGRDGADSTCTLLFADRDKAVQQFFLAGRYPEFDDFNAVCDALGARAPGGVAWTEESVVAEVCTDRERSRRKCAVVLSVLRQHGVVDRNAQGELHLAQRVVPPAALATLVDAYRLKSERDRATLEGMVSYAQSGRCRWELLLAHFEDAPTQERCGGCDNCLRLSAHLATEAEAEAEAREDSPATELVRPLFAIGDLVRTRRHGKGRVKAADALSVTVGFENGVERCFQPQFVTMAKPTPLAQRVALSSSKPEAAG